MFSKINNFCYKVVNTSNCGLCIYYRLKKFQMLQLNLTNQHLEALILQMYKTENLWEKLPIKQNSDETENSQDNYISPFKFTLSL